MTFHTDLLVADFNNLGTERHGPIEQARSNLLIDTFYDAAVVVVQLMRTLCAFLDTQQSIYVLQSENEIKQCSLVPSRTLRRYS